MTNLVLRWLNVLALFAMLLYSWVADARPLNGLTTAEISSRFLVAIHPELYALAIWGAIYVLLIGFVLLQFMPSVRKHLEFKEIGPWFVISCLLQSASILLWHYLYTVPSLMLSIALLLALIVIYTRTRSQGWSADPLVRWMVQVPFSLYLGWTFVMALVRISEALHEFNQGGFDFSGTVWTLLMIFIMVAVATMAGINFRDPAFIGTTVWGLMAIGIANSFNDTVFYTAWSFAGLLLLLAVSMLWGEPSIVRRKVLDRV
ncbi:hypothetical protein [Paenibacillus agricola]|uniref:Tryptophan-rich sensory protein n=1 Tax=Paenibacillus agricola TaxID=2716264 RepID=A0ABX0J159_9BACL|nr:hypothetical protein [Paenibacillus agricola]NHN29418.1 hypothetical protein [Paenibacillus agricola]